MYTELVMDHFTNPRNAGPLAGANGIGFEENPVCGDTMRLFLRIEDNRIAEATFQTVGCGAAIATSSMLTVMVRGMTLEEALTVTRQSVADALGGLPPQKMHCSNLAADALRKAIADYRQRAASRP